MANYNQAPELKFEGKKNLDGNYYALPQDIMDIVFNELGNSSAQLRFMTVLIGTKPGFKISEKWLSDRTGVKGKSLSNARTELIKKGWIEWEQGQYYKVMFDNILGKNRVVMITPQRKGM